MSRGQVAALGQRGVWVPLWILNELGAGTPAVYFAQLLFLTRGDLDSIVVRADSEWQLDTGLTADQAYRARKKLEDVGWLTSEVHQRDGAPVSHLRVAWEKLDSRLREIAESDSAQSRKGRRESAESASLLAIENKTPCSPPEGDDLVLVNAPAGPDPFEAFWQHYPLKAGKKAAARAWTKAIKKETPEALIEHSRLYAEHLASTGKQQYTMHPSTFLNGERWKDERRPVEELEQEAAEARPVPDCDLCDSTGWIINDLNDAAVRCSCRAAVTA